jgi:Glu-tRNA(Gln) amidotransferase subunit E-like FAD-binding protein
MSINIKIKNLPEYFLRKNDRNKFKIGPLVCCDFPKTRCKLIINNKNKLYGFVFYGLEGLFRKDRSISFVYGRKLCDNVKETFQCNGFFTSDELPKYGISRKNLKILYDKLKKTKNDGNLVVFLAYNKTTSNKIKAYLSRIIKMSLKYPKTLRIYP